MKWAGGKTRLLPQLKEIFPTECNRYFEPFLGGGAVFFNLPKCDSYLNDFVPELVNAYQQIRDNPNEVMNEIDKHILKILQKNASIPLSELSKRVGISSTPCWNRIKKMEEDKIIHSKVAILNNSKVNLPITAFLSISIPNHTQEWLKKFINTIQKYDQILETHRVQGSSDYLLKILSPSLEAYDQFQQILID